MAIKKGDLSPIILDILEREQPSHLSLSEIYSGITSVVNLTSEDRVAPRSHGKEHKDEEWKKQTRLALLDMVRDGRVANPSREQYCLPIVSHDYMPLQLDACWQKIVANAMEYSAQGVEFHSPKLRQRYRIGNVDDDSIEVIRLDSDESTILKQAHVLKGVQNLNSCAGVVARRTVNYTVALESAIVELSDQIRWSDDYENIHVMSAGRISGKEYTFYDREGNPISHRFELERDGHNLVVILKSGSSMKRADGTRHNSEYNKGTERLLSVLSESEECIEKVILDTRVTRRLGLTESERTLPMLYPVQPWKYESRELRLEMAGLAQRIGQESGAKGGNNQKQLRVYVRDFNPGLDLNEIAELLSGKTIEKQSSRRLPIGLAMDGETVFRRSNSPEGWVYVITNPKWPEWVKIGKTRNLSKRLSSYNTGSPISQFFYQYRYHRFHENAREIEHKLHSEMRDDSRRGDTNEWYKMSIKEAISIVDSRCD